MLFNVDKNTKRNILAQYKLNAINYTIRKKNEKLRRIQEEREYLKKQEEKEKEDKFEQYKEKLKKKEQQYNEYNLMMAKLHKKTPRYNYSIYNNDNNNINNKTYIKYNNDNKIYNNNKLTERNKNSKKKESDIIIKKDIISKYLTDDDNTEELMKDLRKEKLKTQQFYRELNDSQYLEYQKKNINLYGTIDPLIVHRLKKRKLTENPYSSQMKKDYWKSNLKRNPILNPENNVYYNKYFFHNGDFNYDILNEKKNYATIENYNYKNYFTKKKDNIYEYNNNNDSNDISNLNLNNSSYNNYSVELKNKFFNCCNLPDINKFRNKKEIFSQNNSFNNNVSNRNILRQAVSSNFL